MQAIEVSEPDRIEGGGGFPQETGPISEILRGALKRALEEQGALPRSCQENLSAAMAILGRRGEDAGRRLVHYRGDRPFFPGDLVSLFFMAGAYIQIESGALGGDRNVERDILRTVRGGNIDAANLLLDRITGTLSGPELADANLELFTRRRARLDELLQGIGIRGTRCVQKIWDRPPYGRDAQFLGEEHSCDNQVTAVATALLLTKLLLGQIGGEEASRQMLDLLQLDMPGRSQQGRMQLGLVCGLPPGSRAFGWRSASPRVLHEAAIVELPSGTRFVLVFLSYLGEKRQAILEGIGREVARGLLKG